MAAFVAGKSKIQDIEASRVDITVDLDDKSDKSRPMESASIDRIDGDGFEHLAPG